MAMTSLITLHSWKAANVEICDTKERASCSWNYWENKLGAILCVGVSPVDSLLRCLPCFNLTRRRSFSLCINRHFYCTDSDSESENPTQTVPVIFNNKVYASMHFIFPSAASALFLALVDVLTLFSCMCMMASDTLTEMESVASSMLNGPSNFSETWYRASERWRSRRRCQGDKVVYNYIHSRSYRLISHAKC